MWALFMLIGFAAGVVFARVLWGPMLHELKEVHERLDAAAAEAVLREKRVVSQIKALPHDIAEMASRVIH